MSKQQIINEIYDSNALDYDNWFEKHPETFKKEVNLISKHMKDTGEFLEVGVGTGRFAEALGIQVGIDPSQKMLDLSKKRGIKVYLGVAEKTPFPDKSFDQVFFITSLCFVTDISKSIAEASRVLKPKGIVTIAFLDKESVLGRKYQKQKSIYYQNANFLALDEINKVMVKHNFKESMLSGINFEAKNDARPFDFCVASYKKS